MSITWNNVTIRLGDLKPWEENPRKSTVKQAKRILQSFEDFGQAKPINISPDGEVYDGHQRLSALLTVYGADYEVKAWQSSRPLSDFERRGLVMAFHATAEGEWDWDKLADWDLPSLLPDGFADDWLDRLNYDGAMVATFLDSELDALGEETESDAEPQVSRAEELQAEWGTELGQLWQIGEHRLLIGDCTVAENVERLMGDESFSLAILDPPFDMDASAQAGVIDFCCTVAGCVLLFGVVPDIVNVCKLTAKEPWYDYVWKYNFGHFLSGQRPMSHHKNIFVWRGDGVFTYEPIKLENGVSSSVMEYSYPAAGRVGKFQKNDKMFVDIVESYTDIGGIVFDPFLHSGTSAIACQNTGRKCYGMEISPAYGAVILQRMIDAFPTLDIYQVE